MCRECDLTVTAGSRSSRSSRDHAQVLDIVHELSARHSFTVQRPNSSRVGC
jgi:hypothetical protein